MDKNQIIARLQQLWRKSVTDEFTPTVDQISFWLNAYSPSIISDSMRVLGKYLTKHEMPGDECIRYLGATMRNMLRQRGNVDLSRILVGNKAPVEESDFDDGGLDSDRCEWSPCNDDYSDVKLD
jgi:hypothetical protein